MSPVDGCSHSQASQIRTPPLPSRAFPPTHPSWYDILRFGVCASGPVGARVCARLDSPSLRHTHVPGMQLPPAADHAALSQRQGSMGLSRLSISSARQQRPPVAETGAAGLGGTGLGLGLCETTTSTPRCGACLLSTGTSHVGSLYSFLVQMRCLAKSLDRRPVAICSWAIPKASCPLVRGTGPVVHEF